MEIYFHISLFSVFKHDFIRCVNFTRIAASNTASDDVTNQVTHRLLNTNLIHSFSYFIVKIYAKFSLNDGFQYDLMMTLDSGLLFWATLQAYKTKANFFTTPVCIALHAKASKTSCQAYTGLRTVIAPLVQLYIYCRPYIIGHTGRLKVQTMLIKHKQILNHFNRSLTSPMLLASDEFLLGLLFILFTQCFCA